MCYNLCMYDIMCDFLYLHWFCDDVYFIAYMCVLFVLFDGYYTLFVLYGVCVYMKINKNNVARHSSCCRPQEACVRFERSQEPPSFCRACSLRQEGWSMSRTPWHQTHPQLSVLHVSPQFPSCAVHVRTCNSCPIVANPQKY